jgi:hypothetical protein
MKPPAQAAASYDTGKQYGAYRLGSPSLGQVTGFLLPRPWSRALS